MASLDEEIRLDEEENRRELAFIRTQLPSDVKKFYSDKDILYMMDGLLLYERHTGKQGRRSGNRFGRSGWLRL